MSPIRQNPERSVNQGKTDGESCTARMPFERDCAYPFEIQYSDHCRKQEGKQGKHSQVHNKGLSKNEGITDILKHNYTTIIVPFGVEWTISL